jgi:hypothetical protein
MKALAALVVSASVALSAQRPADDNAFPRTKPYGRATVQYEDPQIKAVAIYDYSQRNHNQPWLLVQFGVALSQRTEVRRDSFHIVTMPDRREVPLATQQQFLADAARIQQFKQNAAFSTATSRATFEERESRLRHALGVAARGGHHPRAGGDSRRVRLAHRRSLFQVADVEVGVRRSSARVRSSKGARGAANPS